ncbi:MAG: hypothetical protein M3457_18895 [Chloroflexota bacterium]|nr:hypothetical protein [Chloroflexota bacterium]
MFNTDLYIDRIVSDMVLADAFGQAYGVSVDRVAVVGQDDHAGLSDAWGKPKVKLLLRTSRLRGDFPAAVEFMVREDALDLRALLHKAALTLEASILTDELDVTPHSDSEWLMFTPDGHSGIVYADDEEFGAEDPAIVLTPKSRALHEAHCPPAGHVAASA